MTYAPCFARELADRPPGSPCRSEPGQGRARDPGCVTDVGKARIPQVHLRNPPDVVGIDLSELIDEPFTSPVVPLIDMCTGKEVRLCGIRLIAQEVFGNELLHELGKTLTGDHL